MGRETRCTARHGAQSGAGKALLETNEIIFRGAFRLVIPLAEIHSIAVRDDDLLVSFGKESASFTLGASEAGKWLKAIRNPKSVLDKLGVKAGHRVAVVGLASPTFRAELEHAGAILVPETKGEVDHLFFAVNEADDLAFIKKLKAALKQSGALWLLRPKGRKDPSEAQTRAAGKAAGLVDVKVVGFSEALSAEKYVIPVSARS